MKKKKKSPSKTVFWVLITSILLCSAVLIYELQQDGVLNNKYIALAKVIPSQQDRWLSLFPVSYTHLDVYKRQVTSIPESTSGRAIYSPIGVT